MNINADEPSQDKSNRFVQLIVNNFWKDKNLKNVNDRVVLLYLICEANHQQNIYNYINNGEQKSYNVSRGERIVGSNTISKATNIKQSTVSKSLQRLKRIGYLEMNELIINHTYAYKILKYEDFVYTDLTNQLTNLTDKTYKPNLQTANNTKPLDNISENEDYIYSVQTQKNSVNKKMESDRTTNNKDINNKSLNNKEDIREREKREPPHAYIRNLENWINTGKQNNIPDEVINKAFNFYKRINFKIGKNDITDIESTLMLFYQRHLELQKEKPKDKTKTEPEQMEIKELSKQYFGNTKIIYLNLIKHFLDLTKGDFEEVKRHIEDLLKNNFKKIATMESETELIEEIQTDGTVKIKLLIKPMETNGTYKQQSKSSYESRATAVFDPNKAEARRREIEQLFGENKEPENKTEKNKKKLTPYQQRVNWKYDEQRIKETLEYLEAAERNKETNKKVTYNSRLEYRHDPKEFEKDLQTFSDFEKQLNDNRTAVTKIIEIEPQELTTSSNEPNKKTEQQTKPAPERTPIKEAEIKEDKQEKEKPIFQDQKRKDFNKAVIQYINEYKTEPTDETITQIKELINAGKKPDEVINELRH